MTIEETQENVIEYFGEARIDTDTGFGSCDDNGVGHIEVTLTQHDGRQKGHRMIATMLLYPMQTGDGPFASLGFSPAHARVLARMLEVAADEAEKTEASKP
jgi:hypothetical protein